MVRALVWLGWALVADPSAARGQEVTGSLTILSRPPGAACRITGDRMVTGRTPLTLARGLSGRYHVLALEPGFEPWQRDIVVDGVSPDTVWMKLRPKRAYKAGLKSLVIPGWGQFYSHRGGAGTFFLVTGLAAAGGTLTAHILYRDRLKEVAAAKTQEMWEFTSERADNAYDARQWLAAASAGIWAVNLIDATWFFPKFENSPMQVGLELAPGDPSAAGATLAIRLRF